MLIINIYGYLMELSGNPLVSYVPTTFDMVGHVGQKLLVNATLVI